MNVENQHLAASHAIYLLFPVAEESALSSFVFQRLSVFGFAEVQVNELGRAIVVVGCLAGFLAVSIDLTHFVAIIKARFGLNNLARIWAALIEDIINDDRILNGPNSIL